MQYYEVWVSSNSYHSQENLTYHHEKKLKVGQIILVELRQQLVTAFIIKTTTKPRFKTKKIYQIFNLPILPNHLIQTGKWMLFYYPSTIGTVSRLLLPINLSATTIIDLPPVTTVPINNLKLNQLPPLTTDQKKALKLMQEKNSYLLHGVTGSGKTRLYIELIHQALSNNQSVLILTPEISLTSQLINNLEKIFDKYIFSWHSKQTAKQRERNWLNILTNNSQPKIIVGPRSVLFSPLANIGLIIIDEAHESAYKQEQAPHYETTRVAGYMSKITQAKIILGSATPSINDYYLATIKNKPIINLPNKIDHKNNLVSKTTIIDLKDRSKFTTSVYLSQELINAIKNALNDQEQTLLYLNRRGTARIVFCSVCGWQALCPHCDTALTYHGDNFKLRCHSCDFSSSVPINCPMCQNSEIIFKTIGTKAIEEEVKRLFPTAKTARFDTDNHKIDRFENNYQQIIDGSIDILIGTQILAKGLDLPKLSTLGVILADTSLYLPDYTATERTYQLLCQVIGRVGRGHIKANTIIQTYQPDHPIIQAAINNEYDKFYQNELLERKRFFFPPYCSILKLTIRRSKISTALTVATKLKKQIIDFNKSLTVEGPAPAFHEKINNQYQWQIIVKSTNRSNLLEIINKHLPANCFFDIDPINLL